MKKVTIEINLDQPTDSGLRVELVRPESFSPLDWIQLFADLTLLAEFAAKKARGITKVESVSLTTDSCLN